MQRSTEASPVSESEAKAPHIFRQRGRIELIIGPMFAGKSTELLRRVKRHQISGKDCLRIKYAEDVRYSDDCISTHDQQMIKAVCAKNLSEVGDDWKKSEVIGIDEGQFFPDIVEFAERAANEGKVVIISALDGTFLRTGFESILILIPKAEKVKKLGAICIECRETAFFTFRMITTQDVKVIGGAEMYKPLCRECFNICHEKQEKINERLQQKLAQELVASFDIDMEESLRKTSKVETL